MIDTHLVAVSEDDIKEAAAARVKAYDGPGVTGATKDDVNRASAALERRLKEAKAAELKDWIVFLGDGSKMRLKRVEVTASNPKEAAELARKKVKDKDFRVTGVKRIGVNVV